MVTILSYLGNGGKPHSTYFPMAAYNFYSWTTTQFAVGTTLAYAIWNTTGGMEDQNKGNLYAVRCVSSP